MNLILLNFNQQVNGEKKDKELGDDNVFLLEATDKQSKHILHHLKKTVGSHVRVGLIPNGPIGGAVITALPSDGSVHLSVVRSTLRNPPSRPLVRILLGIPYPRVTAALWPVMTSLGVQHIIYAPATLTEAGFVKTSKLQPSVYEPMLLEGLSQAEDTRLPRVTVHTDVSLLDLLNNKCQLEELTRGCSKIALHIGEYGSIRQGYLQSASASKEGIFLAIGPERGWTDQEAQVFEKAGFTFASLGAPILRTDTAVVAALALARDVLLESMADADGDDDKSNKSGSKRKVQEIECQGASSSPASENGV